MEVRVKPLEKPPLVREAQVTGLGREECAELVTQMSEACDCCALCLAEMLTERGAMILARRRSQFG